jgi:hypothetical protein
MEITMPSMLQKLCLEVVIFLDEKLKKAGNAVCNMDGSVTKTKPYVFAEEWNCK